MKRLLWAVIAVLVAAMPAAAQKTPAPFVLQQYFSNTGAVLSAGGMCVFAAGTSTLATSYTTAGGGTPNANPILFNSAGRPSTSGFFLTPGVSYKLVLKDFTGVVSPTCVPDTGVTVWTQDNIQAIPGSSGAVEVTGTAGESIAAGDAVYLSDGTGGRTQGTWYRTDADFTYASSNAYLVGVAEAAINSAASGQITLAGLVDVPGSLSPGSRYWASATAGAITTAMPANNFRQVGVGYTTTSLVVAPDLTQIPSLGPASVSNAVQVATTAGGRCTLTTAVPITVSDVTAATTVYYTPYRGTAIGLYTGSAWVLQTFAEMSIAVPGTTNTMYDLFVDYNDGAPVLATTAWTNDTTRATALVLQDGVPVKTGDTQQRYVCSFRTTGVSGQTQDTAANRWLWNAYNRVFRVVRVFETTNSWTQPASGTWRQANGAGGNQIGIVVGLQDETLTLQVNAVCSGAGAASCFSSIGLSSTTTPSANATISAVAATTIYSTTTAVFTSTPPVGYAYYAWLERVTDTGNNWFGDDGGSTLAQSGMTGRWPS